MSQRQQMLTAIVGVMGQDQAPEEGFEIRPWRRGSLALVFERTVKIRAEPVFALALDDACAELHRVTFTRVGTSTPPLRRPHFKHRTPSQFFS